MTHHQRKNMAQSVKTRLLNFARENGEDFNLLLIRYGIERLLYRLSKSEHADGFVLKGAILFQLWADAQFHILTLKACHIVAQCKRSAALGTGDTTCSMPWATVFDAFSVEMCLT